MARSMNGAIFSICQKVSRFSTNPKVPLHAHPTIESRHRAATPALLVHSATGNNDPFFAKVQPLKPRTRTVAGFLPVAFFESLRSATALLLDGRSPLNP